MNCIAGVLIGLATDGWTGRLIAPFLWGFVWCARLWILGTHRSVKLNEGSAGERSSLTNRSTFYVIEYGTAVTALTMPILVGAIKALF